MKTLHNIETLLIGIIMILIFALGFMIGSLPEDTKGLRILSTPVTIEQKNDYNDSSYEFPEIPEGEVTVPHESPESTEVTDEDLVDLAMVLKMRESSNRKWIINRLGYIGYYQFGVAELEQLGYIKRGEYNRMKKIHVNQKTFILKHAKWNRGLTLKRFMASCQEEAFIRSAKKNYRSLKQYGFLDRINTKKKILGLLAAAHLKGLTATKKWIKGALKNHKDANGVTIEEYYHLGESA